MTDEDDFIARFREQLHHVSDFITVVLNAHLEIESNIDKYVDLIFPHPKYLEEARLSFYEKLCIARAYTPLSNERYEWDLMIFINTMRNKIAHRSRRKPLHFDVSHLRSAMEKSSTKLREELAGKENKEVVVYAAAVCSGFLAILEEQLAEHRGVEIDDN